MYQKHQKVKQATKSNFKNCLISAKDKSTASSFQP
jgi:hypothetical protein